MKLNFTVRMKNPWFWFSLAGVILTAMGVEPATLTSWQALAQALTELVRNPYLLAATAAAVLGVLMDPTTKGLGDSSRAMSYDKPKEEECV